MAGCKLFGPSEYFLFRSLTEVVVVVVVVVVAVGVMDVVVDHANDVVIGDKCKP